MCGGYTGEFGEQDVVNLINRHEFLSKERDLLVKDLVELVEAEECYNETYYKSEYSRITNRLQELQDEI